MIARCAGTALLCLVSHSASSQSSSNLSFRSDVRRVLVDVFVSRDGRPVSGLRVGDFEVLDNGVVQTDVSLLVVEDLPLVATLLLDTSQSVRGKKLIDGGEGWHSLAVRVKEEHDSDVRARPGYYHP